MTNRIDKKRPNCAEVLYSAEKWTLNENEIKDLKIFEEFETLLANENEFFLNIMKNKHDIFSEKYNIPFKKIKLNENY